MKPQTSPERSVPLAGSVLVSLATLFLTYDSPLALVLATLYAPSLILPYRWNRDSASIWGVRLLAYGAIAVLGRGPVGAPDYLFDSRAFATAGLLAAGEIVIQAWREAPRGYRFDPLVILLTGVIFLVASNTLGIHIWYLAPIYMLFTLLALSDTQNKPRGWNFSSTARQIGMIACAVSLGFVSHQVIWANRGSIMALGVRLLADHHPNSQGSGVGDTSTLTSGTFGAAQSPLRLLRIQGPLHDPHLRGATFDEYHRGTWGPPLSKRALGTALDGQLQATAHGPFTDITLLQDPTNVLFFPLNCTALVPAYGSSFDWDRFSGPVKTEDPAPYTYHFMEDDSSGDERLPPLFQGPLCVSLTDKLGRDRRSRLLEVPDEIRPEVRDLATQITASSFTPAEKAEAITEYLLAHYKYSLTYLRGNGDPVSDFLLNNKAAHCQYFASAAVILLRMNGVPARYATGYYAHEQDGPDGLVVRQNDAHAWAEAYIDGVGWVVVEATPPDGRADPQTSPLPWYQHSWEKIQDTFAKVRAWFGNLSQLQILGSVVCIVVLWILERWRVARRKGKHWTGPMPPAELAPLARRFERALEKRGVPAVPEKPWSETVPAEWSAGAQFVAHYNRVRFQRADAEDIRALQEALQEAEKP